MPARVCNTNISRKKGTQTPTTKLAGVSYRRTQERASCVRGDNFDSSLILKIAAQQNLKCSFTLEDGSISESCLLVTAKRQSFAENVNSVMPKTDCPIVRQTMNQRGGRVQVGATYGDKSQGQEQHRHAGEYLDVIALLDGPAALLDRAPAEELLPQADNLLPDELVRLEDLLEVLDDLLQLLAQRAQLRQVVPALGALRVRVRPQRPVAPGPELWRESVRVHADHGFDAVVDDAEGIVGPEISPAEGEVRVLE